MRIRTRRVPAGYRELEYIEFTGTQQINTYLNFNMDIGILEIDFQSTTLNQNGMIIGNTSTRYFWIYHYHGSGKINCYLDGQDGGQQNLQGPSLDLKKHHAVFKNKTYYLDDVAYGTATGTLSSTSSPYLFIGSYGGNYYYQGRIFGCKVWNDGQNLTRNFIPAERISDGVVGFYNSVSGDFYENNGSGTLIKGPYKDSYYIPVVITGGTIKIGSPKINLLPLAYQGVEYIESSGTQYIDTGISIGDKYEFVLDQLNNFDTGNHYMCGSSTAGKMLGTLSNVLWSNGLIYTNVNFNRNVREKIGLKVSITNSSGADYVTTNYTTNKNMSGHSSYTPSGTSTVLLFRVGSIYETFKCYNFKLYKDEQLMRNMIPCYRKSDNVIGLYDTVTRTFYTNSGTGTFAKGANKDYII